MTPGIAVRSQGTGSQEAIVFYAVGGTRCSEFSPPSSCSVSVGYVASRSGGWGETVAFGWRMRPKWFPGTRAGNMWGDYIAATFLQNGRVSTVLPLARPPSRALDGDVRTQGRTANAQSLTAPWPVQIVEVTRNPVLSLSLRSTCHQE